MHASSDEIDVSLVVLPLACHLRMFRTMRGRWDTTGLAASRADRFFSLRLCGYKEKQRRERAHLNLKNLCIEAISRLYVCGRFLCSNLPGRNQQWREELLID
jgi:hypothetical protein